MTIAFPAAPLFTVILSLVGKQLLLFMVLLLIEKVIINKTKDMLSIFYTCIYNSNY